MIEIQPLIGVGALRLGMSQAQAGAILGPPDSLYFPEQDDIFDEEEELAFYRGQTVEIRGRDQTMDLFDLTFENDRLVRINLRGDSSRSSLGGMACNGDRMRLLDLLRMGDPAVYIRSDDYLFLTTGLCVSRAKNRKDMNYLRLYDPPFKQRRLAFELYKPHTGALIP